MIVLFLVGMNLWWLFGSNSIVVVGETAPEITFHQNFVSAYQLGKGNRIHNKCVHHVWVIHSLIILSVCFVAGSFSDILSGSVVVLIYKLTACFQTYLAFKPDCSSSDWDRNQELPWLFPFQEEGNFVQLCHMWAGKDCRRTYLGCMWRTSLSIQLGSKLVQGIQFSFSLDLSSLSC